MRGRIALALVVGFLLLVAWISHRASRELYRFRSEDPSVWEQEIAEFERSDRDDEAARDAVLFMGSSGIRRWETLAEDMAPFPVVGRGFGGAKITDILYYAERLVARREPRAIMVFAGGNDLFEQAGSQPKSPERVAALARELGTRLRALRPASPVYFIAMRPPIRDPQGRDPLSRANALIEDWAESHEGVGWIDANRDLYGPDGRVRPELLGPDRVHLTRAGYRTWATPIRERLLRDLRPPAR